MRIDPQYLKLPTDHLPQGLHFNDFIIFDVELSQNWSIHVDDRFNILYPIAN